MKVSKELFCPNPACVSKSIRDSRTALTPWNVLYKCESAGRKTYYFTAPRKFLGKFSKKVISPVPGCKGVKINTSEVYCPNCRIPIYLDRESVKISVVGPRNCGKTVYLSVLNELVSGLDGNLMFSRERRTEDFTLTREERRESGSASSETFYILPRPTQAGSRKNGADGAANVPYMDYHVTYTADNGSSFSDWTSSKRHSKSSGGAAQKREAELYFYDCAGEWFMPQEEQSTEIMDARVERNKKIAHLFNSDLILFMIDCRQMLADSGIDRKYLKTDGLSRDKYIKAIEETVREISLKNKKEYYIAFCFLAVDICEHDENGKYREIIGKYDFNYEQQFKFNAKKYRESSDIIWRIFDSFRTVIFSQEQEGRLNRQRIGIFAITALGRGAEIREDKRRKISYIKSFNPVKASGVLDPILWYLAKKGIIDEQTT